MDFNGTTRLRHRRPPSSDRFLGSFSQPPSTDSRASTDTDELNENDIFFTVDTSEANQNHRNHHSSSTTSSSSSAASTPPRHHLYHHIYGHNAKLFSEPFGILAALPETSTSHFYRKASFPSYNASTSTSSGSSATSTCRMIPSIPKPPQDRLPLPSSLGKYHQSAPVNVPVLSKAMRRNREFDEVDLGDDDDDEGDGEMLPPHEIVARGSSQSPLVACSVLEGVGRTLKGRDLRQVRNAVWRRTGFLD